MEQVLTPLQRIWRTFAGGRPSNEDLDGVLGFSSAIKQHRRLLKVIGEDKNVALTSCLVVITGPSFTKDRQAVGLRLVEGSEQDLLSGMSLHKAPRVLGLIAAIQSGAEKRMFGYPMDRTAKGLQAFNWEYQRQLTGVPQKATN